MVRKGDAEPDRFGIFDLRGDWFIRGNVVRDLAALNKVELLPWDAWGVMPEHDLVGRDDDDELVDRIAACIAADDTDEVRALFEGDDRLRVGAGDTITSYIDGQPITLRI